MKAVIRRLVCVDDSRRDARSRRGDGVGEVFGVGEAIGVEEAMGLQRRRRRNWIRAAEIRDVGAAVIQHAGNAVDVDVGLNESAIDKSFDEKYIIVIRVR